MQDSDLPNGSYKLKVRSLTFAYFLLDCLGGTATCDRPIKFICSADASNVLGLGSSLRQGMQGDRGVGAEVIMQTFSDDVRLCAWCVSVDIQSATRKIGGE